MVRDRLRNWKKKIFMKIHDIRFVRKIRLNLHFREYAINPEKRKEMDEAIDKLIALKKAGKLDGPKPITPK